RVCAWPSTTKPPRATWSGDARADPDAVHRPQLESVRSKAVTRSRGRPRPLVYDASADDRDVRRDIANPYLGARQRILRQHDQVSELSGHDRALLIFLERQVGALEGRGPEGVGARQALRGPDDTVRDAARPGDRLPDGPEQRGRHVVSGQRDVDARGVQAA